jgi:hypothetical protein
LIELWVVMLGDLGNVALGVVVKLVPMTNRYYLGRSSALIKYCHKLQRLTQKAPEVLDLEVIQG